MAEKKGTNARGKPMVSILTLGACSVMVNGRVVAGVPSSFFKIATYLMLSGSSRVVSRQRLRSLLWSEVDDQDRAAANLRQALARVRDFQKLHGFQILESNFTSVFLVDDVRVRWDLVEFLSRLASQDSLNDLHGLYAGELLADLGYSGTDFEDWLTEQRYQLRNRFIDKLATAMAMSEWTEMPGASRRTYAYDILAVDPCNEEAYRVLMLDAASSRNLARLEHLYQSCERNLANELGVDASVETRTLYTGLVRTLSE